MVTFHVTQYEMDVGPQTLIQHLKDFNSFVVMQVKRKIGLSIIDRQKKLQLTSNAAQYLQVQAKVSSSHLCV